MFLMKVNVRHDGKKFNQGEEFKGDGKLKEYFLEKGFIEEIAPKAKEPAKPAAKKAKKEEK